jgi:hypothetical protein
VRGLAGLGQRRTLLLGLRRNLRRQPRLGGRRLHLAVEQADLPPPGCLLPPRQLALQLLLLHLPTRQPVISATPTGAGSVVRAAVGRCAGGGGTWHRRISSSFDRLTPGAASRGPTAPAAPAAPFRAACSFC